VERHFQQHRPKSGLGRAYTRRLRQGLCAKCIVLDHESRENFLILLHQHVDRFHPADEVEFNMIEQRRAWPSKPPCSFPNTPLPL
jgi:hypothetical protein